MQSCAFTSLAWHSGGMRQKCKEQINTSLRKQNQHVGQERAA